MRAQRPVLPTRLLPFSFHFFRQFAWGCLGLLLFPVLGRAVFASIAYATKRLTDTVLAMHDPATQAREALVAPFTVFAALVASRFVLDAGMWFCSYHTRSPMLVRMKEEIFAYAQRLSPAYFESTLSGKIAHRAVLLPDEATSALDSHSEHVIQEAMRAAMVGKTVIAIAHRLSTVMDMDRLIVLQRGMVVADGSHAELLRQGGLYAELWQRQSGEFNPAARHPPEPPAPRIPPAGVGSTQLHVEHPVVPSSVSR